MADDTPATPSTIPTKPPLVQVQKAPEPVQPKKRDYLIDAVFCSGCGKFAHYMTSSYIADPNSRIVASDPTPIFHEECYKARGKFPPHRPPALLFTRGVVKEAVYRIFWSQLPDKDRKPIMMDA